MRRILGVRNVLRIAVTIVLVAGSSGAAVLLMRSVRPAVTVDAASPAAANVEQPDRPVLDLPTEWVAFSARVRVFSPDMAPVHGRFYRSSTGSQRLETGPDMDGPPRTIDIRNIPSRTHYLFVRARGESGPSWSSAPMDVAEYGGLKPLARFADQKGLTKYRHKLSFREGQKPSVFATEGFEVYHYADLGGNIHLQAPELNMFDLVNQAVTGRREEYIDIVFGEPDARLFEPPSGVAVTATTETRGMRFVPKTAHQRHEQ